MMLAITRLITIFIFAIITMGYCQKNNHFGISSEFLLSTPTNSDSIRLFRYCDNGNNYGSYNPQSIIGVRIGAHKYIQPIKLVPKFSFSVSFGVQLYQSLLYKRTTAQPSCSRQSISPFALEGLYRPNDVLQISSLSFGLNSKLMAYYKFKPKFYLGIGVLFLQNLRTRTVLRRQKIKENRRWVPSGGCHISPIMNIEYSFSKKLSMLGSMHFFRDGRELNYISTAFGITYKFK